MTPTPPSRLAATAMVAAALACAPATVSHPSAAMPPMPKALSATTALTQAQRQWVDSTLASLTLRERVGQMIVVWMLGDYTSTRDSSYAEIVHWIEQDKVGGATVSLGTPIEVAAKLNDLQRRARVPLLVSSDLEPGLGRLESGV